MKKTVFTLMMAFTASMMWAQTSGLTISYKDGNETKEQTFNLDSVQSYGYNPVDQTVFVQPTFGVKFSISYQNLVTLTYPPIVADSTGGVSDYLVVNVNGQKAAFLLAEGLEMTWKGGVLLIKDKKQSQAIGLRNGIYFTIESLSFGYTNPGISSTPRSGNWYLVVESMITHASFTSDYRCIYYVEELNGVIFLLMRKNGTGGRGFDVMGIKEESTRMYISSTPIGTLY